MTLRKNWDSVVRNQKYRASQAPPASRVGQTEEGFT